MIKLRRKKDKNLYIKTILPQKLTHLKNLIRKVHILFVLFVIVVYIEDQFCYLTRKNLFILNEIFNLMQSFDTRFYICKTCDKKMIKNKTPCQAVNNKLGIYDFPEDLKHIRRLERVLIARRLHFKKINIMHKDQFPKMKGAICNVLLIQLT